jgi:hypothetical protein
MTKQYLVLREREFSEETVGDLCVRYGVHGWYYPFLLAGQRAWALYVEDVVPSDGSGALVLPLPLVALGPHLFAPLAIERWKQAELAARIAEDYRRPLLLVGVAHAISTAFAVRFAEGRFDGAEAVLGNDRYLTLAGETNLESRAWPDPPGSTLGYAAVANRAVGAFLDASAFPFAFDHLELAYHDEDVVDVG